MKTTWQNLSLATLKAYSGENSSDVVIIGGGITGISTAYLLAKAGKSVIVVEKEELLQTTTAYTTAFLTSSIDTKLSDLKKIYGISTVKKIVDSHEQAINKIEEIIKDEKIECEFTRVMNYSIAFKNETLEQLKKEKNILDDIGYKSRMVLPSIFPFKNFGALELKNQAKFHPLKYLVEIRKKAEALGVQFFEHSEALSISGDKSITVKMTKGNIKTNDVVIATYNPFQEPLGFVLKKGIYTSYVMELEVPKGVLLEMLMEDDSNPYHYVRVDNVSKNNDRLIIGGQDHRKEIPINKNRGFNALKDFIQNKLLISNYKIVTKWTGGILESSDGLALIGIQSKKFNNRYVATAFSGNGMTYGIISAIIISDLITKNNNSWQEVYDPRRSFSFKGVLLKVKDYSGEFINGMVSNLSHSKKPLNPM